MFSGVPVGAARSEYGKVWWRGGGAKGRLDWVIRGVLGVCLYGNRGGRTVFCVICGGIDVTVEGVMGWRLKLFLGGDEIHDCVLE